MTIHNDAKLSYEKWHAELAVDEEASTPWHDLVKQHIDLKRDLADRRILEMACGRGGFAVWLAQNDARPSVVVAADFAQSAVAMGKRFAESRGADAAEWNVGDITRTPYPSDAFDTIFCCETIEHVPFPRSALAELARILKPGGRLFLTTPNYFGIYGLYRIYLRLMGKPYTEEGQPINHPLILPRTLNWVRKSGLKVTTLDGVGHYLLFPGVVPKRLTLFDKVRVLTRWSGLHSLIIAVKPQAAP